MPTSLQDLITLVRQESNTENNQVVTDAELTKYINASLAEMDDIMINTYEDYRLDTYQATLVAGNFLIGTPAEMYKLRGVDIQGNGAIINGAPPWFPVRRFQLIDRGRRNNLTSTLIYPFGKVNIAYFWQGGQGITIMPQTQAQGIYQIWWVSKFRDLVNLGDVLDPAIDQQAWIEYAVVDSCIKVLGKQDLDPSIFMARKEPLRIRIIGSMSNRDVSGPNVRVNTRGNNSAWGGGYGGTGYGGSYGY